MILVGVERQQADCKSGFYPRGRPFRFKLVKLFHCN